MKRKKDKDRRNRLLLAAENAKPNRDRMCVAQRNLHPKLTWASHSVPYWGASRLIIALPVPLSVGRRGFLRLLLLTSFLFIFYFLLWPLLFVCFEWVGKEKKRKRKKKGGCLVVLAGCRDDGDFCSVSFNFLRSVSWALRSFTQVESVSSFSFFSSPFF